MSLEDISKAVAQPRVPISEIGVTGLERDLFGYIHEEWLTQLQGLSGIRTYREMWDGDPIVGGIIFSIEMLSRQVDWRVEPYESDPKYQEDADFLASCMDDMSHTWDDFIAEVLSMIPFGWSAHEIVYKRRNGWKASRPGLSSKYDDGRVGWRKLPIRSQPTLLRWEFREGTDEIAGMWQLAPPRYKITLIPIEKLLLFRPTMWKNNPEGRSALRSAYRPWFFKKRLEEIEGVGVERDLAGLPVAWVDQRIMDANATAEEKALLQGIKDIVVNVRRDTQEGLVLPLAYDQNGHKLFDFQLLNSGGTRQFDTTSIINRYNQAIAMSVLADFILIGHGNSGSFALQSNKVNLFATALSAWLESIAQVINRHAVPRLFAMNGMQTDKLPTITFRDVATPDLGELAQFIVQLAGAGASFFPDKKLEDYLRQVAKLPPSPPLDVAWEQKADKAEGEAELQNLIQSITGNGDGGGEGSLEDLLGQALNPRGGAKTGPNGEKINPAPRVPGARGTGPLDPKITGV